MYYITLQHLSILLIVFKAQEVEYYIPESMILGKYIYRFTFANSGFFLTPYKALVRGTLEEFNWTPITEEELRELCLEIESEDAKKRGSRILRILHTAQSPAK
jgi:hypothetical protein